MAAENAEVSEITESNPLFTGPLDMRMSSPWTADLHECLHILRRIDALLTRFAPLLDQASTSPLATRRALRKAGRP